MGKLIETTEERVARLQARYIAKLEANRVDKEKRRLARPGLKRRRQRPAKPLPTPEELLAKAERRKIRQAAYQMRPEMKAWKKAYYENRRKNEPGYREAEAAAGKAHFQANKQRIYARRKAWPEETKARNREWLRQWMNNKRETDPHYCLGNRLRSRLWHALDYLNAKKAEKTTDLVGCSVPELKAYLESKFMDGMSWANKSEWHIDHIVPCASFDLKDPEQQKKCFHYTNLQPLWGKDNQAKGDKLDWQPAADVVVNA